MHNEQPGHDHAILHAFLIIAAFLCEYILIATYKVGSLENLCFQVSTDIVKSLYWQEAFQGKYYHSYSGKYATFTDGIKMWLPKSLIVLS